MASLFVIEADCYLGGTSATARAIVASGAVQWTLAAGSPLPLEGMTLRLHDAAQPATFMEGIVVAVAPATLSVTLDVRTSGGSGSVASWIAGPGTLRFATAAYATAPGETPGNVRFEACIMQAGEIARYLFDRGTTGGASRVEAGDIVLANADGALDALLDYGMDGRQAVIRVAEFRPEFGERPAYPAGFVTVLTGTLGRAAATLADVTLPLRTRQFDLDVPFQPNAFAGNNALPAGVEGTADDLKGRPKPRTYGSASNVPAVPVNTSKLIYQVNDGAVAAIPAVYDRGIGLVQGVAYVSQADMEATAPAASGYRVWPAGGYFRLGSTPSGQVTADVTQSATASARSVAGIVSAIVAAASASGGTGIVSVAADTTALQALQPALMEFWQDGETTVAEALDRLCAGVGVWWGFDRLGQFRVKRLDAPTGGVPVLTFRRAGRGAPLATAEADILGFELYAPADQAGGLPVRAVTLAYAPNWQVQTNDVAGAVTAARRAWLAQGERDTAPAADALAGTKHKLADTLRIASLLIGEADANAERDRVLALRKVRRDRVVLRTRIDAAAPPLDLGDEVRVVLPRFGYGGAGRAMRTIGQRLDARSRYVTWELWG